MSANQVVLPAVSVLLIAAALYYLFRPEREEPLKRVPSEGGLGLSDEEKEMTIQKPDRIPFIPSADWQPVEDNHICPAGLEYRLNLTDGTKFARLDS